MPQSKKPAAETAQTFTIPFTVINLQKHFERSCDLWTLKDPSLKIRLTRTAIFVGALLCTVFWPVHDLVINIAVLLLAWIFLSLTSKPLPRFLLMFNIMMNLAILYTLIKFITRT